MLTHQTFIALIQEQVNLFLFYFTFLEGLSLLTTTGTFTPRYQHTSTYLTGFLDAIVTIGGQGSVVFSDAVIFSVGSSKKEKLKFKRNETN